MSNHNSAGARLLASATLVLALAPAARVSGGGFTHTKNSATANTTQAARQRDAGSTTPATTHGAADHICRKRPLVDGNAVPRSDDDDDPYDPNWRCQVCSTLQASAAGRCRELCGGQAPGYDCHTLAGQDSCLAHGAREQGGGFFLCEWAVANASTTPAAIAVRFMTCLAPQTSPEGERPLPPVVLSPHFPADSF